MSLLLNGPGTRVPIEVQVLQSEPVILMSDLHGNQFEVGLADFLAAARHVLTTADLEPNDPRLKFVEDVKVLRQVPGWNVGAERLSNEVSSGPRF